MPDVTLVYDKIRGKCFVSQHKRFPYLLDQYGIILVIYFIILKIFICAICNHQLPIE